MKGGKLPLREKRGDAVDETTGETQSISAIVNPSASNERGDDVTGTISSVIPANGAPEQAKENGSKVISLETHEPSFTSGANSFQDRITRRESDVGASRMKRIEELPALQAAIDGGKNPNVAVTLTIEGHKFAPVQDTSNNSHTTGSRMIHDGACIGDDGNQFYCDICREFGEIVCCDGCPRVYHPACIPLTEASRQSLERDDDPWYCPKCIKQKPRTDTEGEDTNNGYSFRRSRDHRCVDCREPQGDLELQPCKECGNYVHVPSCQGIDTEEYRGVYCSACRAVDALTKEDDEINEAKEMSATFLAGLKHHPPGNNGEDDFDDEATECDEDGKQELTVQSPTPRKRKTRSDSISKEKLGGSEKKRKKKDNPKKQKKTRTDSHDNSPSPQPPPSEPLPYPTKIVAGKVQATPAFYFFLAENRWKVERALSRTHRYFNRLPKGLERNDLVSQEAARWWVKLRPADHKRYMNMSMRDFESRILEWKEEKYLEDTGAAQEEQAVIAEEAAVDQSFKDEKSLYRQHQRLYLSTSVGSKPFKPEQDQSYNRVLLDLLHDIRFHSMPMLCINRSEHDTIIDDHNSKVTIPHYEVHGPISTSVGDECLGCTRGWLHYCPVLQRRIPCIDARAKLQPPLSSLVATRVGLGLRPHQSRIEVKDDDGKELFEWRKSEEMKETQSLLALPSATLSNPSDRADDVARFIEETIAMKVPEPPRPSPPVSRGRKQKRLPLVAEPESDKNEEGEIFKCGRCRTIIYNDTGCVQCRRAQLVINTTKKHSQSFAEESELKVQTIMLGRIPMRDGIDVEQSSTDMAVSNAILKERWTPSVILAPRRAPSPMKHVPEIGEEEATDLSAEQTGLEESRLLDVSSIEAVTKNESREEVDATKDNESHHRPQRAASFTPVSITTYYKMGELDQDDAGKEKKKQTDELFKKVVSIACSGIFLAMRRRDPLLLLNDLPTAEGHEEVTKNHIDMNILRSNVLGKKYATLDAFLSDAKLLCDAALHDNPGGSIYAKTASELLDLLEDMQVRAHAWIDAIIRAFCSFQADVKSSKQKAPSTGKDDSRTSVLTEDVYDPFTKLREEYPDAVDMLANGDWLVQQIDTDFFRTRENETAYYGSIAVQRVAAAAEASLAPYTDSCGIHSVVARRNHIADEHLRQHIDCKVALTVRPLQLTHVSSWREEAVVRLLRKVQSRRLDRNHMSESGCSRCDGFVDTTGNQGASMRNHGRDRRKDTDTQRVHESRIYLTTGLGSAKTCQKIIKHEEESQVSPEDSLDNICVSVRSSRIHGLGLFADQPFKKGDIVAEYVGEWVPTDIFDKRENKYHSQHIQDYHFRVDEKLIIDATFKGGHARYINHNCSPSCYKKIISGKEPNTHLKRVLIVALRDIPINTEITYDYQFPLEMNLSNRIPCNCHSEACRGFMNWDIPEKGSRNEALLVQKRGTNMRDRIRRLGRTLKRGDL